MTHAEAMTLKVGDRLMLNEHGRVVFWQNKSVSGVFIGVSGVVRLRIQRDGIKRIEVWNASYWRRDGSG